jgi:hypothetical protein
LGLKAGQPLGFFVDALGFSYLLILKSLTGGRPINGAVIFLYQPDIPGILNEGEAFAGEFRFEKFGRNAGVNFDFDRIRKLAENFTGACPVA